MFGSNNPVRKNIVEVIDLEDALIRANYGTVKILNSLISEINEVIIGIEKHIGDINNKLIRGNFSIPLERSTLAGNIQNLRDDFDKISKLRRYGHLISTSDNATIIFEQLKILHQEVLQTAQTSAKTIFDKDKVAQELKNIFNSSNLLNIKSKLEAELALQKENLLITRSMLQRIA